MNAVDSIQARKDRIRAAIASVKLPTKEANRAAAEKVAAKIARGSARK